jgi:hypothetical protein
MWKNQPTVARDCDGYLKGTQLSASAGNEVEDQNNQGDDEEQRDQGTRNMGHQSEQPQDDKNDDDGIEHPPVSL